MNAVIWDFDGTLVDTYSKIVEVFRRVLREENIQDNNSTKILSLMRISITHTINYYIDNYNLTEDAIERFNKYEKEINMSEINLYPNAKEICKWIYDNGKKNFLYTHKDKLAIEYLKHYNILNYFTECITRENGFPPKPSPNSILYLIDKYNLEPNNIIMIGDRDIDILAAKSANIKGVFFKWNMNESDLEFADYNITNFDELKYII